MKAGLPGSIKDAAGSLSRQRRNEILAVRSRPLRVSPAKRPGPAAGQASPCDLCSSLSDIMSVLTISWRHAIRVQLCVSADPCRHSCLLTTAEANTGFLFLMGGNRSFRPLWPRLVTPPHENSSHLVTAERRLGFSARIPL